mgnify:CR=1 FL=1
MANRSRFENGIMESIWSEISESGFIDETIEDNKDEIHEALKEYISGIDVSDFIDVEDDVEAEIENQVSKAISEDSIAEIVKDSVNLQSILNIISETPEFKKLIQDKVLEEFNKLWV